MLRIIGDVHGKYPQYFKVIENCEYSVQIGDMGYHYEQLEGLGEGHKFFKGNHDNHNLNGPDMWLGEYGPEEINGVKFYFVGGAFSVDKEIRIKLESRWGKTWFENEELSMPQLAHAVNKIFDLKPEIILTHDCPSSISQIIGNPDILRDFGFNPETFRTITQMALDLALSLHKPKLWVFGHYHRHFDEVIDGTRFICLPELGFIDINNQGEVL